MKDWEEARFRISHEDMFSGKSRWCIFWEYVIKRRGMRIDVCFNPPEAITDVYIDYIGAYPMEKNEYHCNTRST